MLDTFRRFFNSRFGVGLTLGLVGLIALAFAAGDIVSGGGLQKFGGGNNVARVGKQDIGAGELSRSLAAGLARAREQNPQLTMPGFLAGGGLDLVLDGMLDRTAISEFGRNHGIIAGKRLVDSELTKIPALQGLDGKFSETAYRQLLTQRQLTDAEVRSDIAQGLVARQVMLPAQFGAALPSGLVARYAALLTEHRTGTFGIVPAAAFAPKAAPADAELAAWYAAHRNAFIRPERRVIRWASFGDGALKAVPAPTDAEIAARYERDKAQYAASETRKLSQLVLPTEPAAKAVLAELGKGVSLDASAKAKGLAVASVGPVTKEAYAEQSSTAAADAAFGAARGKVVGPVKGSLGWLLVRVDAVDVHPARSLDQARPQIAAALSAEKRKAALADLTAKIEEQFDKGGALDDTAKDLALTLQSTPPLTADGRVYGTGQPAPPLLAPVVQTAFAMEREQAPQLAEVEPGKTFVVFDVARIEPSAAPPLAEIKGDVTAAYLLEKGAAAAKAAALRVLAETKKGKDLPAALASLGVPVPPPSPVSMGRQQLGANGAQIPAPLMLLFSMAQGTTKLLPAPRNAGWIVVQLKSIEPGKIDANAPLLAEAAGQLGQSAGNEYIEALRLAIRAEVGVKRNDAAIKAVVAQATGGQ